MKKTNAKKSSKASSSGLSNILGKWEVLKDELQNIVNDKKVKEIQDVVHKEIKKARTFVDSQKKELGKIQKKVEDYIKKEITPKKTVIKAKAKKKAAKKTTGKNGKKKVLTPEVV